MKGYYFSFRSVTAAQKALRTLTDAGIPASMGRTPGALAKNGCGYCLRVAERWGPGAARALRDSDVGRCWLRTGSGFEEVSCDLL